MSYGGFLVHRNPKESEDEPEILRPTHAGDGREAGPRYSPRHLGRDERPRRGRRHGISEATFYKWKAKFGGLEVTEAKRLRTLEEENAKLKKLLAEAMLDIAVLKDISSKKW